MDKPKQADCSARDFDRLLSLILTEATALEAMERVELIDVTGAFGGDVISLSPLHVLDRSGPDSLRGGGHDDTIFGGTGNDII